MSVIPCKRNKSLRQQIEAFAETLKTEAHTLGDHGLSPRNNPSPQPQQLSDVEIMRAFNDCFQCTPEEINYVSFDVAYRDADTVRTTRIVRDGATQRESSPTAIRRS